MHNAGIAAALQPAHLVGGACVIAPSGDPGPVLELIARERVSVLPVSRPRWRSACWSTRKPGTPT